MSPDANPVLEVAWELLLVRNSFASQRAPASLPPSLERDGLSEISLGRRNGSSDPNNPPPGSFLGSYNFTRKRGLCTFPTNPPLACKPIFKTLGQGAPYA
ncbi:hypothetical protein KIL84_012308 [Mauremys mutica]|uniref:Uncharacterized protein n=1 Tax=Mauremys mutica TaxID=74926 RepID=A0A9D4B333_9SAUR|nr:hypothetical protein KIL84_012308 [Mauremys mutica]